MRLVVQFAAGYCWNMRRQRATIVLCSLALLLAGGSGCSFLYYAREIRPNTHFARTQLQAATAANDLPPEALFALADRAYGDILHYVVARNVGLQPPAERPCPNALGWHPCQFLLSQAFKVSFTHRELGRSAATLLEAERRTDS